MPTVYLYIYTIHIIGYVVYNIYAYTHIENGFHCVSRENNLETSGAPLSGSHSLWECWSEDERKHTIAIELKVIT